MQRIDISAARTFQQANKEPLGEDWHAEVRSLHGAKQAASAAVQKLQSNADPGMAQLRSDAAQFQRIYAGLPDSKAQEGLLQRSADLLAEAKEVALAAGLQPTEVRAGKQARRRAGRNPEDRVVKPLLPHRRKRPQADPPGAPEDRCDELPTLAKRGKAVNKVRPGSALGQ
jgi:hypothetical protein